MLAIPAIGSASPYINDEGNLAVDVSYADLNLTTKAGLLTLYGRLKAAAKSVCGPRSVANAGSLAQAAKNTSCYRDVLSKSVAKVNNAELDKIHAA